MTPRVVSNAVGMYEKPRIFAAKLAARMLLQRIWRQASSNDERADVHGVLIEAPKQASSIMGVSITFAPSIPGGEKIAGLFDRLAKNITISTRFSIASQRFTFAHEIGHLMLHGDQVYFRDREISEPSTNGNRPYYEIEADTFAAEFLMPQKHLEQAFLGRFEKPIDYSSPETWLPIGLQQALPLERAKAIAAASICGNKHFASLARYFEVSNTAMGIQLLKAGLVR